jgi:hypothetical protein
LGDVHVRDVETIDVRDVEAIENREAEAINVQSMYAVWSVDRVYIELP